MFSHVQQQDIKVLEYIQLIGFRGLYDTVNKRACFCPGCRCVEQGVLPANRIGFRAAFGSIIRKFTSAVLHIALQCLCVVYGIIDGFFQLAAAKRF